MNERPLTTMEVSELLGVPEPTLRWWRYEGRGPRCYRLGGRKVVYDRADLERWVEEQKAATVRGG
ncbi:helix-turn-helix domain-containing protein [Mycolicibacterium smegmatis]|uniref:helix-turn-helix transcriptional regulator n=1 Tax=Mycolicibacterium smegmatis TaxID=1772 RepID=UPI0005D8A8AB|nr:helix-turn-helix domain-containing protein [Mycolicibacterium smegmatis]MDF1899058.1 helix-turn-helix domain-containing protein [Mycolicibacterium smegmatis]MDF1904882.1 helix-turn-helix domain-containing protein [Mycolicibacterium smegmatis]MDF1918751.1 helix-turn-helix domain-containing protein [Mycolicibacterium smegmatis]MDF1924046.1 helix-turn-helix domain-containing protein [Mycolicibacterium smegmatis]UAK53333.1 helix-turn-helix domain-containing protein [Mycolicibacterium smegmatis]